MLCTCIHHPIEAILKSNGIRSYADDWEFPMVTILIDHLPLEFRPTEIYELLKPFSPFRVYLAADACGVSLGFAFALFTEEVSARKAHIALGLLDTTDHQLCVVRTVAPRTPGELTG